MTRSAFVPIVVGWLIWGSGCAPDPVRWIIEFDGSSLRERAAAVRAEILAGGCDGTGTVYAADIVAGTAPPVPGDLSAGVYGFHATALDSSCTSFAEACEEARLPRDAHNAVRVLLVARGDTVACEPDQCHSGVCAADAADAGMPDMCAAGIDAGGSSGGGSYAVAEVTAGQDHACARLANDEVRCWGQNSTGQLGDGTTTNSSTPSVIADLLEIVQLASGTSHACARRVGGSVACWGSNADGQVGVRDLTRAVLSPETVYGLSSAAWMNAGGLHTCAVLSDGTVRCWGDNAAGAFGVAEPLTSQVPVAGFDEIADLRAVAAGGAFTCVLTRRGAVYCAGANSRGQLGNGSTVDSAVPVEVASLTCVDALAAGDEHVCAIHSGGAVACWGDNAGAQLGRSDIAMSSVPVNVTAVSAASSIAAGWAHTCAVAAGTAYCWGRNGFGQLGRPASSGSEEGQPPDLVTGLAEGSVVQVATGQRHSCAVLRGGDAYCWGSGSVGQLGNGMTRSSDTPVRVEIP